MKCFVFQNIRPVVPHKKRGFSARFSPGDAVPPPRISPFSKVKCPNIKPVLGTLLRPLRAERLRPSSIPRPPDSAAANSAAASPAGRSPRLMPRCKPCRVPHAADRRRSRPRAQHARPDADNSAYAAPAQNSRSTPTAKLSCASAFPALRLLSAVASPGLTGRKFRSRRPAGRSLRLMPGPQVCPAARRRPTPQPPERSGKLFRGDLLQLSRCRSWTRASRNAVTASARSFPFQAA